MAPKKKVDAGDAAADPAKKVARKPKRTTDKAVASEGASFIQRENKLAGKSGKGVEEKRAAAKQAAKITAEVIKPKPKAKAGTKPKVKAAAKPKTVKPKTKASAKPKATAAAKPKAKAPKTVKGKAAAKGTKKSDAAATTTRSSSRSRSPTRSASPARKSRSASPSRKTPAKAAASQSPSRKSDRGSPAKIKKPTKKDIAKTMQRSGTMGDTLADASKFLSR